MSKTEQESFNAEMIKGLELAEYRMLLDKAMHNQTIIQGYGNDGVREISARELFTSIYHEQVPTF